ncbi:hypothetical protein [Pseudomonas sp. Root329]|uniref:hypothetical protein n=1 Tax=Pseudomonas sp. Root329 TaxID=1736515 RepID=UPI0012E3CC1D|nr:hypothetical protein [Pseudomonas sp. Root329]
MPIMVQPRKIATEGALGSRSGDQQVSQFNTARINVSALYRIKKKSGSLESIDRALPPPETTSGSIYSEKANPIQGSNHSLYRHWQELSGGPTQIICYLRPFNREILALVA